MKKLPEQNLDFEETVFDGFAENLDYLELPLSRQTFFLVAVFIIAVNLAVAVRLGFINVFKSDFYKNRSAANISQEVILPAYRGVITDRFGEVLAENLPSFSVFANVPALLKNEADFEKTAQKLSEVLEIDEKEIREKMEAVDLTRQNLALIARNITPDQIILLKSLNLTGVSIEDDYKRSYEDGRIFSQIIGYDGPVKIGLEAVYDGQLKGQDGLSLIFENAKGETIDKKTVNDPTAGGQLALTIDADFQRFFYNRLEEALRSLGRTSGVGLALNPQNGEILSLVSLPSFDNNLFVSFGNNQEKRRLLNSPSKPLFNRVVSGVYNPGSTIKPLVALAALKENLISPETEIFSRGYLEVPNPYDPEKPSRFLDWKPNGWVDLRSALARSSNIYFYAVGGGLPKSEFSLLRGQNGLQGLGIEKLNRYWKKFLLDQKTGIDLSAENSGFLPDPEEKEQRTGQIWRLGDTYNVSIGQGDMLITPLQLLNFIASLANDGKMYRPHLIKNGQSDVILDYSDWRPEIEEIQAGLRDVVAKQYGTANLLNTLPVAASGKTGSAQIENNTKTNAFFVGYAPAENPQIAILVLIENAREGSLNAVPVAKDVFEWYYYNRLVAN